MNTTKCVRIPGGHLSIGQGLAIRVNGKTHYFEMPYGCGIFVCNKHGDELRKYPGPKHDFWKALNAWQKQGERMDGDFCVWDHIPPRYEWVEKQGRHHVIVPEGTPGARRVMMDEGTGTATQ